VELTYVDTLSSPRVLATHMPFHCSQTP
jgi:hypothetical protein